MKKKAVLKAAFFINSSHKSKFDIINLKINNCSSQQNRLLTRHHVCVN